MGGYRIADHIRHHAGALLFVLSHGVVWRRNVSPRSCQQSRRAAAKPNRRMNRRARLSTIFEMFQTGGGENSGLGVGLAVVKALTEVHGGTVRASSEGIGRGSEFMVTLPRAIRPAA